MRNTSDTEKYQDSIEGGYVYGERQPSKEERLGLNIIVGFVCFMVGLCVGSIMVIYG